MSVHEFVSRILCAQENDQVFYKKQCVGGKKCEECYDLALFNANYHIDANDPQISNHIVKWKRYEYVDYTHVTDSTKNIKKDWVCWRWYLHDMFYGVVQGENM